MENKKFVAVEGAHISDKQAEIYGNRMEKIKEKNGFLTPELVVKDATNSLSPLHDYFDWNNDEAAEKWRIEQARKLIRSISITIINDERPNIRYWYSIKPTQEMQTDASNVYVNIGDVAKDTNKQEQVIEYALMELKGWKERYKQYQELKEIVSEIEAFLAKAKK